MSFLILTKSTTFIIGPIATLLGYIMEGIYNLGVHNIALCIILFTLIVNLLMLPLTLKQQKFMKLNSIMQPEINAINKKYKGKQQDQAAMQKQNAEIQAVYRKYGTSPTGGCLQTVIQLPILFALYQVIYRIPAYITGIKNILMNVVTPIMNQPDYINKISALASAKNLPIEKIDYTQADKMVDLLGKFNAGAWDQLKEVFPSLSNVIADNSEKFLSMNSLFGGLNLMESPGFKLSIALIIPILAGVTQWLSMKTMNTAPTDPDMPGASSMKMMNNFMPIMSVIFCITLPIGVGLYWIASAAVRMIMQLGINQYLKKESTDDMIKKNIEKQNKKRAKKGLPPISEKATIKTVNRNVELAEKKKEMEAERAQQRKAKDQEDSTKYYQQKTENMGTIASRARMVQAYDDKKKKK